MASGELNCLEPFCVDYQYLFLIRGYEQKQNLCGSISCFCEICPHLRNLWIKKKNIQDSKLLEKINY